MPSAVSRLSVGVGALAAVQPARRAAAEAFAAVALAADAGVRMLDCPCEPEEAERILGQVLPREPAFEVTIRTTSEGGAAAILRRVRTSLRRMKIERAGAVLARPATLLGDEGSRLWAGLQKLKEEGAVDAVGVAACVCDDPVGLARRFRPDLMQLPLSLLDQRLLANGTLDEIAGRGVEVHLRSIFSHGLIFSGLAADPLAAPPQVSRVRRLMAEAGADPMQAALAFAFSRPQAAKVVVGVASAAELRAVVRAATAAGPVLDWEALRLDARCGLDPARCRAA